MLTTRWLGRHVEVALPDHWYELPLDPRDRDNRIARLVERRVGPDPALRDLRRRLVDELRRVAASEHDRGALLSASMSLAVADDAVGAHLVVMLASADGRDVHGWAEAIGGEVVELLRVGPVARSWTTTRGELSSIEDASATSLLSAVPTLRADYVVPVRSADPLVARLHFTSSSVLYAQPLLEMFDVIASSFRVTP